MILVSTAAVRVQAMDPKCESLVEKAFTAGETTKGWQDLPAGQSKRLKIEYLDAIKELRTHIQSLINESVGRKDHKALIRILEYANAQSKRFEHGGTLLAASEINSQEAFIHAMNENDFESMRILTEYGFNPIGYGVSDPEQIKGQAAIPILMTAHSDLNDSYIGQLLTLASRQRLNRNQLNLIIAFNRNKIVRLVRTHSPQELAAYLKSLDGTVLDSKIRNSYIEQRYPNTIDLNDGLRYAVKLKKTPQIDILLAAAADPFPSNEPGRIMGTHNSDTPLAFAIEAGEVNTVSKMMDFIAERTVNQPGTRSDVIQQIVELAYDKYPEIIELALTHPTLRLEPSESALFNSDDEWFLLYFENGAKERRKHGIEDTESAVLVETALKIAQNINVDLDQLNLFAEAKHFKILKIYIAKLKAKWALIS